MEIADLHALFLASAGVQTDSRKCREGEIFFALKGAADGNRFVTDALAKGCSWAVADDPALEGTPRCILTDDALATLQALARYHRRYLGIPVLALTGSNGKTTTKELLARVLAERFRVWATPGNFNNHIGVPLTLLGIPQDIEFAVVEMGANAQGEIRDLCAIAEPDYGLITNIGKAHLEGFGGEEGVKKGKGEMYDFLKGHGRTIFYLSDEPHLPGMVGDYGPTVSGHLGADGGTDAYELLQEDPTVRLRFHEASGRAHIVESHLYGRHNARNIALALVVGRHFGIAPEALVRAVGSYSPTNNRSQVVQAGSNRIVLDAYNANPGSMAESLRSFAAMDGTRKLAILGDMRELGEASLREHQAVVDQIQGYPGIEVVLVGDFFPTTAHPAEWPCFPDAEAAGAWLKDRAPRDTVILVKGSRGIALERAVAHLLI